MQTMQLQTRKQLLSILELKEKQFKEYSIQYGGAGLRKKIKRLLKYRNRYLKYCISKLRPGLVKTKTFWGEDFWAFLPEEILLYFLGLLGTDQEIKLTKFLIRSLPENSIFYDVGAFGGFYCLLTKKIVKNGEIHAFEPSPKAFWCLKRNSSNYKNIFLNQMALFDREGEIDFYDGTLTGQSGFSTFDISTNRELVPSNFKKIKVRTITLDKYSIFHSKPTFLKIDVEGAEKYVIEGGSKLLKETKPTIAIEIWRKPLGNTSYLKAMEILYNLGYKSYEITENGELKLIEKIAPEKDISEKNISNNFIFKK